MNIDLEDALASLEDARIEDRDELVANALFKVGEAYLQRGRLEEAAEALDEARYLCDALQNPDGLARLGLSLGRLHLLRGEPEAGLEPAEGALAHFSAAGDVPSRVSALELTSQLLVAAGRLEQGTERLQEALALAEEAGDLVGRLLFGQYLASLLRQMGRLEPALARYRQVGRLAHELGDLQRVALAAVGVGTLAAELGDWDLCRAAMEEARTSFESLGQQKRADQVRAELARLLAGEAPSTQTEES